MTASVIDFPGAGQRNGQGRPPAPTTPPGGVGGQQPYTKLGREIAVGDQIRYPPRGAGLILPLEDPFLVVAFTDLRPAERRRIAINVWAEPMSIDDSHRYHVFNPSNAALRTDK